MEFDQIPIDWIEDSPHYPRADLEKNDQMVQRLRKSIQTWGYRVPIVWNEETGHLVDGYQRLRLLKERGGDEVFCSIVNLGLQEEKICSLALNRISGKWHLPKLKRVLHDLVPHVDLDLLGWSSDEMIDLFVNNQSPDFQPISEDEQPRLDELDRKEQGVCPHCGKPLST